MAKQNAVNLDVTNNADGAQISGGVVKRFLKWLGADITFTGSGAAVIGFPGAPGTLITQDQAWPVGSIFTSIDPTNPVTTLGFGTWAAFGAGRVLAGHNTSGTFNVAAETTGGEETHALSVAELASHSHSHNHVENLKTTGGSGTSLAAATHNATVTASNTNTDTDATAAGSGTAHNNLQPYIVVYFWKRTA